MNRPNGFVLPIIVLLLTFMALIWAHTSTPVDPLTDEQRLMQRYQDEILFWQKAVLAYSFEYDRVPLSAFILANTYDLELPVSTESGGGWDFSVDGLGLLSGSFNLRIHYLPADLLVKFSEEYSPYVSVDSLDRLNIPVLRMDDWLFSERLMPRIANGYADRFASDLELDRQGITRIFRLNGDSVLGQLSLTHLSSINELTAETVLIQDIQTSGALVAGHDFGSALMQFEQLEQAMRSCLAPTGGCLN
ncbi:hypothetical protein J6I92_12280 [Pseudidiomarina sp. 1APR75-15]|uniref:Uncharacterized protein n=1 Tax=Pseudidiomarina terrestris TaxID=2820060 RepID=A0ABT8ML14_9GAMM|nr:hypothetical protein [Pseudidiomarina sp. 1APR75-15]MDN7130647.1 hypothetical protein [Pseudidiomarina sp. 1APR75-15]